MAQFAGVRSCADANLLRPLFEGFCMRVGERGDYNLKAKFNVGKDILS